MRGANAMRGNAYKPTKNTRNNGRALALHLGQTCCKVLAFMLLILIAASIKGKILISLVLAIAVPRYILSGLYQLTGLPGLHLAAGIVGLVVATAAAYGALALLLEDAFQRTVLPMGRRGGSSTALRGDLDDQLSRLRHEAGVRRQL